MPCWYFSEDELQNTPSFREGIPAVMEKRFRTEGARFIIDLSQLLKLKYDTFATAVTYFHRFYMFHSFTDSPKYVAATCCLLLAGKVEETPKKIRDIIKTAQEILPIEDFRYFGPNPKELLIVYEKILLKTIKFDLAVIHPYSYLLKFAKMIICPENQKESLKKVVQSAWGFINDSLSTTLCLQWEPEIIACSVLYLGAKINKFTVEDWENRRRDLKWWETFVEDMTVKLIEDICHQILDIYSSEDEISNQLPGPTSSLVMKDK